MKNPTRYSDREGNTIPLTKGDIRRLRKIEALFHPSSHNTYRHIPLDAFSLNRIFRYRPMVTSKMLEDPKTLPFNIGDYIPAMRTVQDFAQIPNESPIEAKVSEVAETPPTETMPEMTAPAPAAKAKKVKAPSKAPAKESKPKVVKAPAKAPKAPAKAKDGKAKKAKPGAVPVLA